MDSILDYVKWLGHETFSQHPFNEIDNLVLCQLSYYELSEVFPEGKSITLSECVQLMDTNKLKVRVVGSQTEYELYKEFFETVASSPRYMNIPISDYVDILDDTIQFAAMTFHLAENLIFVAFRGTDDTIIGWKEDFMISFTEIPAQVKAAEYLKNVTNKYSTSKIYIGGHSKGGNLALYSALLLARFKWPKIIQIYLNDSPGICSDVMDTSGIEKLKNRITMITPQFCVIGRLFEPDVPNCKIVKCSNSGLMQHMMLHWGIDHGKLLTDTSYSPESNWISESMNIWIENVTNDKRQNLVDQLFSALTEGGAKTLSDISGKGPAGFEQVFLNIVGGNKDALKTAAGLPEKAIFGDSVETLKKKPSFKAFMHSKLARGIGSIILGVVFLMIPQSSMEYIFSLVMTAFVACIVARTIYRLARSKWDLYKERTFVLMSVIGLFIYQFMIFKEHALFLLSNIFFGVMFLMASYSCACVLRSKKDLRKWVKARYIIEMILFFVLGMFDFVSPEHAIETYALSVGVILILDGISRIVEHKHDNDPEFGQDTTPGAGNDRNKENEQEPGQKADKESSQDNIQENNQENEQDTIQRNSQE